MYGTRARIGCIIPSTNTVVESEFNRLKPSGVSIHADRVEFLESTVQDLQHAAGEVPAVAQRIATAQVDAIVFACTSASFLFGTRWEQKLVNEMQAASGIRCITTSGAVIAALETLGAKRVSVATPYTDVINEREKVFLEERGLRVQKLRGLQKTVNTEIGRLAPKQAFDLALQVADRDMDALFISCTDFRTIEIIEKLERQLGVPVVTSNQGSFWHAMRCAGIDDRITGYGKLLAEA